MKQFANLAIAGVVGAFAGTMSMMASAKPDSALAAIHAVPVSAPHVQLDRSGRSQVGKASFYASRYSGKTMADGTAMNLHSNNAASLTLPLGTTAQVINLETGLSAVVTIRDRGPYVSGRIVDLSPATAKHIGIGQRQGLARVRVVPLSVPQADGSVWVSPMSVALNN